MNNINKELYDRLVFLGIIPNEVRAKNIGASNYSEHTIQPYSIWIDWDLNPWDADIIKRVLRTKQGDSRKMDYEKIIHVCQERIRQIDVQEKYKNEQRPTIERGKQYRCIKDFEVDEGDRLETLFTAGFYYNSCEDGIIVANDGMKANVNDAMFNEHFKEINE